MVPTTTTAMTTTAMPSMRPMRADFLLQRRRLLVGGLEHLGDRAHLGVHPGGGDHGAAGALRDGRALEDHVEPVAERRRPRQRGGILEHGFALAGQRGFLHAQRRGLHQARIRADGVALAEHEHVATHQLGAGHAQQLPVAHDARGHRGHPRQRGHGVLRLGFLHIAQNPVEQDDQRDDDRIHRPAARALDHPGDERDGDGAQQQVDERILELRQEATPGGCARSRSELVGAVLREPARAS